MEKHVHLLGIFFIVFGVMGLFGTAVVFFIFVGGGLFSGYYSREPEALALASSFGILISGIILAFTLPAVIAGWGLLKYKSWARILALIVGIVNIFSLPFGTALGIYAIWVLFKDETIQLFERPRDQPPG